MAHPRTANSTALFVFLAVATFLISGNVMASPNPGAQQGRLIPPLPSQLFNVQVLSALPEGVDFEPYLRNLDASIGRNLLARLPKSAANGEKGVVVVRVHIQNDGSLPYGAVRIVSTSGKNDMDAAAQSVIRTAAPFGRLPVAYLGSNLDLLFTFSYNSIPQEPAQKPKVVRIGTITFATPLVESP
jgi:TonB family protein